MRIGASLFLIAVGAVLRFAVTVHHSHGFDIHTVGVILMVIGAVGLLISLIWMGTRRRTDVIQQVGPGGRHTTRVEPNDPIDPAY